MCSGHALLIVGRSGSVQSRCPAVYGLVVDAAHFCRLPASLFSLLLKIWALSGQAFAAVLLFWNLHAQACLPLTISFCLMSG